MDITLRTPLSFSEKGNKDNQEDRIYPQTNATQSTRTFILCDGMGGHARGEVAAEIVSSTLGTSIDSDTAADVSGEQFNIALKKCYSALDAKLSGDDSKRPGTTLTCIQIGRNGVLAAHIGDSRIYQVRPGQGIMFRSEDHSLVNELVRTGQISEAEARVHPRRNVITRAMMPGATKPSQADISILTDIRSGDYFFLCCDGVLERLHEQKLIRILSDDRHSDEEKLAAIKAICDKGTHDNYTAWLIPVDTVTDNDTPAGKPRIPICIPDAPQVAESYIATPQTPDKKPAKSALIGIAIIAICAIVTLFFVIFGGNSSDGQSTDNPDTTESSAVQTHSNSGNDKAQEAAKKTQTKRNNAKPTNKTESQPDEKRPSEPTSGMTAKEEDKPLPAAAAAAAAQAGRTKPESPAPIIEPTPQPEDTPAPVQPQSPDPITE